jgi:hypothetical protein
MSVPQQAALHGLLRHAVVSYKVSQEKITNLQWLHRSLMNTLKEKAPGQSPAAHWKLLYTVRREYQKHEPGIVCWLSICETG